MTTKTYCHKSWYKNVGKQWPFGKAEETFFYVYRHEARTEKALYAAMACPATTQNARGILVWEDVVYFKPVQSKVEGLKINPREVPKVVPHD